MKHLTTSIKFLIVASAALSLNAYADSWSCRHDNDVREIHIVQETDAPVPCSVVYKKLTEGVEDQVLWTAQNDANYCEEKAKAFVEKQTGWGWTCVETISDDDKPEQNTTEESSSAAETEATAAE